jgi:hypothetical protein
MPLLSEGRGERGGERKTEERGGQKERGMKKNTGNSRLFLFSYKRRGVGGR